VTAPADVWVDLTGKEIAERRTALAEAAALAGARAAEEQAELDAIFAPDEEEQDWQERALCAQTDPEAFFPEKGGSTREAKKICGGCEVRSECLEYALAHDERFGIWGGLSERERRRLRRRALSPDDAPPEPPAQVKMCRSGTHEMAGDNVRVLADGTRRCKKCVSQANARAYVRRTATAGG